MSIAFSCACGRSLRAGPHLAGKKTKCPGCGAVLTIPAASEDAASAAPPAPPAPKPKPAPAAAQVTAAPAAAPIASAVTCTCGKRIATKPEWAGKTIKCPACENKIKVPAAAALPVVPAAAAAKPAPAKRPAPPPPPLDEEDPFGGDDSEGLPADFDPETGGYQGFSDNGDTDDDDEAPTPPRKGKQAPAKKGGSKVLFVSLVVVLLLAAAGAGYFAFIFKPEMLATGTTAPTIKPVKPGAGDADDESDPKKPLPKIAVVKPTATEPEDLTDPKTPDAKDPDAKLPDPKTPPNVKGDLPLVPPPTVGDLPVPPSEKPAPEKKVEPKKTGLPTETPKFGPPPLPLKIDLDPDDPKEGPEKSVFDFVPSDAISFAAIRVGAFIDSPSGAKVKALPGPFYAGFVNETEKNLGVDPKDVRTVLLIAMTVPSDPSKADQSGVVVVETSKPIDMAGIAKQADSKSEVAGKTMYFKKNDPVGILQLSPTRLLNGTKEMVTALINGTPKAGPLSVSLKAAAASKAIVFVGFQMTPELAGLRDKGLDPIGKTLPAAGAIADVTGGQLTISEEPSLKIALKLTYSDADKAEQSKKAIEELVEQGSALLTIGKKEIEKLPQGSKLGTLGKSALASVKPSLEGETLTVPLELSTTIGDLAEIGMSFAPMMMGAPPGGPNGVPPAPKQIDKE